MISCSDECKSMNNGTGTGDIITDSTVTRTMPIVTTNCHDNTNNGSNDDIGKEAEVCKENQCDIEKHKHLSPHQSYPISAKNP